MIDDQPDAVIELREMKFSLWLSGSGVSRLHLPDVGGYMRTCRSLPSAVRIDTKKKKTAATAGRILESAAAFLEDVMNGKPPRVVPAVDLASEGRFTRDVLGAVALIQWGETRSYSWVASCLKRPGAARAVGNAVARNPVPLLVPCHRVVRSDGGTGGWSGPPGWKEVLLRMEEGAGGSVVSPAGRRRHQSR